MPWYEHKNNETLVYSPMVKGRSIYKSFEGKPVQEMLDYLNNNEDADTFSAQLRIFKEPSLKTPVEVPAGSYRYEVIDRYPMVEALVPFTFREDTYAEISSQRDIAQDEIKRFLDERLHYENLGIIHKRGLLFYGPPGEGKTAFIRNLVKKTVPANSIIVLLGSVPTSSFLKALNKDTGDILKVFVFEEFATIASDPTEIRKVLEFLDGENSINHSITIATTNHPELIPSNIVDRPSRFDRLIKFKNPDEAGIRELLKTFLKREATEEEMLSSKGASAAAIKEACIQALSKRVPLADIYKQIKLQSELVRADFAEPKKMGFSRSFDD